MSRDSPQSSVFRFQCSSKGDITRLIHLFNGNLVLKKTTSRFHQWVQCFNTLHGTSPPPSCLDTTQEWSVRLSESRSITKPVSKPPPFGTVLGSQGFLMVKGAFSRLQGYRLRPPDVDSMRVFRSPKRGEPALLMHLAVLLNGGSLVKTGSGQDTWTYKTSGKGQLALLGDYLQRFPLRTRKKWSYGLWTFLNTRVTSVDGLLSPGQIRTVRLLARSINRRRESDITGHSSPTLSRQFPSPSG